MNLNLTVDEVLTTTRSVRKRLDLEKPVPREVLKECLELAIQAPTGSNAQRWQWVFVDDPGTKKAIADVYRGNALPYLNQPKSDYGEGDVRTERMELVSESARYLADHLHEVPVMLIPCLQGRVDDAPRGLSASFWASLFPAAWSFLLALRSRGLGSTWTTLHLVGDGERKVAEILGIPYEEYSQGGLFPIAYTKGTDFRPATRVPVEKITHWNHW
ncbi:MAG: nitroreductase [Mycobacterium sp.]|jgi:nitroreductase|nr:nitroreductase [Mycobacterium sp.]